MVCAFAATPIYLVYHDVGLTLSLFKASTRRLEIAARFVLRSMAAVTRWAYLASFCLRRSSRWFGREQTEAMSNGLERGLFRSWEIIPSSMERIRVPEEGTEDAGRSERQDWAEGCCDKRSWYVLLIQVYYSCRNCKLVWGMI